MMGTAENNPIYQRLTKDINWERHIKQLRLAMGLPIGIVGATVCCVNWPQYNPAFLILNSLAYLFMGLSLIALPAAASATSATAVHRMVHGEEFELIWLTTLPSKEIAGALVDGMKVRLSPVRTAANSLLVATMVFTLLSVISTSGYPPSAMVVSYAPLAIIAAFVCWLNNALMTSAILGGTLLAVRFRRSASGGASITAGFVVAMIYAIGLVAAFTLQIMRASTYTSFYGVVIAVLYLLIPVIGNPMMRAGIEANLERTRLSEKR